MAALLQLSLCFVIAIQLTSSQSTYDVLQDENDVNSCGGTEQVLRQLVTAVSQLQKAIMQLQRDAAGGNQRNGLKGMTEIQQQSTQPFGRKQLYGWSINA